MNAIDRLVGVFSPVRGLQRVQARRQLRIEQERERARYDGAQPSRTRKVNRDNGTAERHIVRDAATVRAMARNLERNHDIVRGAFGVLVRNTVGPTGISVEPQPRNQNDDIDDMFARTLLNEWRLWGESSPEVTGTMDWVQCQQLMARTVYRDGECLARALEGRGSWTVDREVTPLCLEMLEPDMLPLDYERETPAIYAGIERNEWDRPTAYYFHKQHPGSGRSFKYNPGADDLERVPASVILHPMLRDRFTSLRGISVIASGLERVEDWRDYESSERLAASLASRIALAIIRDKDMQWSPPDTGGKARDLHIDSGAILDALLPGESIDMLNPSRPNPAMVDFLRHQHRGFAAGVDGSYSSISRDYNGSFAAQRQELIESYSAYQVLTHYLVAQFIRPVWRRFVRLALASGRVKLPAHIRPDSVYQAEFRGPAMPWIDPVKEATAQLIMVRAGFKSEQAVIAERGGRLQDTYEQIARARRLAAELKLSFDSNAALEKLIAAAKKEPPADPGAGNGAGASKKPNQDNPDA